MRVSNKLIRPIITEKSVALSKLGKYIFKVNKLATKGAIANEVERTYGVNVNNVKTSIMAGKKRRKPGTSQFRTTERWKKAIVQVKEGQTIDLFTEGQ
jgi:large subunit ribosomal protein L23